MFAARSTDASMDVWILCVLCCVCKFRDGEEANEEDNSLGRYFIAAVCCDVFGKTTTVIKRRCIHTS